MSAPLRGPHRAPLAFEPSSFHNGFRFVKSHAFAELNIVAYEFTHEKTLCQYFHIDTADTNNVFCVGFGTPAVNSKGTTHVLEHTVLCGSRKYPVRDPFFAMLRRSLSTFMNAMTGADYTLYPFATVNAQDFSNLLDVYLDSVFHPLLRRDDFRQEGHRLELPAGAGGDPATAAAAAATAAATTGTSPADAAAAALKFNGVVYNEMRGVVSEPSTHFSHLLMRTMLPGTHYQHVSGGHPVDIVDLTYEELVAYHRAHYHPSNAIVMTYGDLPPSTHMHAIRTYLDGFEPKAKAVIPALAEGARFAEAKHVRTTGPLDAMGNPTKQKRTTVSIGVPQANNTLSDLVKFVVTDQLLTSGPSSPLYKALIQSQLGSRFSPMSGYAYYLTSPIVAYGVEGLDQSDTAVEQKVADAVLSTLQQVAKDGFDPRRVDSVVFQEELQQKHRSANYGIGLLTTACAMGLTRPQLHPLDFVNWVPHLSAIVADQKKTLLPALTSLLASPHRAQLTVSPSATFLSDMQAELEKKEAVASKAFAPADLARLKEENETWLARVRAPSDFSVLPTLRVSDIPRLGFVEPTIQPYAGNTGVFAIPYPTNGLVYVHGLIPFPPAVVAALQQAQHLAFASGDVTQDQLFLPLMHALLGKTGAGDLSDDELSIAMDLTCSGIGFGTCLEPIVTSSTAFTAGTSWSFYTTYEKLPKALDLLQSILAAPRVDSGSDEVRRCVLSRVKARCASRLQSLQRSGNAFAVSHAAARMTSLGYVKEHWGGVTQNNFSAKMLQDLQAAGVIRSEAAVTRVIDRYASFTQSVLGQAGHSLAWATCQADHTADVAAQLSTFMLRFRGLTLPAAAAASLQPPAGAGAAAVATPPPPVAKAPWEVELPLASVAAASATAAAVAAVELPIDTSFVGSVVTNTLDRLSHEQQALRIACALVKNEYLHRKVREEGGAYGSSCSPYVQGAAGGIALSSYRDPSPDKTVAAFDGIGAWLRSTGDGAFTASMLDSAKLSFFSTVDAPYSADSFGSSLLLSGSSDAIRQRTREMLLAVDMDAVRGSAALFESAAASRRATTVLKPAPRGKAAEGQRGAAADE